MNDAGPTSLDSPVVFEKVSLAFGERVVLQDFSCDFPRGRISVILGGSGAGKTTILRLIGGLLHPQAGRVIVAGQDISDLTEKQLYGVRARIGMMFQGGALLNSLTIEENLAFPLLEHTRMSPREVTEEVARTLSAVGLTGVGHLLPGQLSGGMIKRAALARAILMKPEILLCDEPFSGLDPISVKRIEALLCRLNRELGVTMLVSSHHIPSTMRMADRVVLLWDSAAIVGSPGELRDSPQAQVAEFFNEEVNEGVAQEPRHVPVARW